MEALAKLAGQRHFLMVGDSKLVSYPNLAAINRADVTFIAPASKSYVGAAVLAAVDFDAADRVDYIAQRDAKKTEEDRGSYRVFEDTMILTGKKKAEPDLCLRRVFVWSSARAGAAERARAKKLDRARGDLERLGRGLGGRYYPTEKEVTERIAMIRRERRVKSYLRTTIGTDPTTTKPTLEWHFDETALAAEASTHGWYALLTNLSPEVTATDVLHAYKGQEAVERRYSNFKGPIAVAPMFLKNNRRIEALITVICLALLIFSLVERAVRLALSPAIKLAGLWAGRPAKPTGAARSSPRSPTSSSHQPPPAIQPRSPDRHHFKPGYSNSSTSTPDNPAEQQTMSPTTSPSHVRNARLAARGPTENNHRPGGWAGPVDNQIAGLMPGRQVRPTGRLRSAAVRSGRGAWVEARRVVSAVATVSSTRRIVRISEVRTENNLVAQESTTCFAASVRKKVVICPSCR